MKIGQTIKLGGELFTIKKEYSDFYLVVDEFLTTFKKIPKLVKVK